MGRDKLSIIALYAAIALITVAMLFMPSQIDLYFTIGAFLNIIVFFCIYFLPQKWIKRIIKEKARVKRPKILSIIDNTFFAYIALYVFSPPEIVQNIFVIYLYLLLLGGFIVGQLISIRPKWFCNQS